MSSGYNPVSYKLIHLQNNSSENEIALDQSNEVNKEEGIESHISTSTPQVDLLQDDSLTSQPTYLDPQATSLPSTYQSRTAHDQ